MPIGSSANVQFEDDLEAAEYDIKNGFVLGPSPEQMRDPMEIDPSVTEDPSFDSYLKDTEFSSQSKDPETGATKLYVSAEEPKRSAMEVLTGSDGKERYQTWPEKAFRSLVDAFKLPGDVAAGKVDPGSEKAIGRAFDLAGMMVFGPAPIAAKVADGTLGSFAGVQANLPKDKLMRAKELVDEFGADVDKDLLWKETGFFRGVDGQLRYEISDANAILKDVPEADWYKPELKLSQILDHKDLYQAYPELKDVKVKFNPRLADGTAEYDYATKEISLGPDTLSDGPSLLLHEIQHWIQHKENFAAGGMTAKAFMLRWQGEVDTLKRERDVLFKKSQQEPLTADDKARLKYIKKVINLDTERHKYAPHEVYRNYRRLAGEEEAYNVERRFENREFLFDEETKAFVPAGEVHPLKSMEYTPEQQAVFHHPTMATPYGYGDPMRPPGWGLDEDVDGLIKHSRSGSEKPPTPFRRAANDNTPLDPSQGKDPFQLPSDFDADYAWAQLRNALEKNTSAADKFETRIREGVSKARKRLSKELDELDKVLGTKEGWTKENVDKYNRMYSEYFKGSEDRFIPLEWTPWQD